MSYQMNQIGHFMVKMTIMLRNKILEKVQQSKGLTDKELLKMISKDEVMKLKMTIMKNKFKKVKKKTTKQVFQILTNYILK